MEEPQWEQCKENAQPLRKGRSAVDGIGALGGFVSTSDKLQNEQRRAEFEAALVEATSADDKIDAYVCYYTWSRRCAASNLSAARALLERCTKEVSQQEDMKNDPRLLKIWIEYAEVSPDSHDVFSYMYTNKLGVRHSLFWIAWAFVAEKANNVKLAEQVFLKGLKKYLAEPRDLLSTRYKQFQRRMTRRFLSEGEAAPHTQSTSHSQAERERETETRRGLSVITEKTQRERRAAPSHTQTKQSSQNALAQFEIFSDDCGAATKSVKENWNNLGNETERRKENTETARQWSGAQIASTQRVAPTITPFSVFEDAPLCENGVEAARVEPPQKTAVPVSVVSIYEDDEEDGTINTKLALRDIESLFSSPSRPAVVAPPAQSVGFQIFSDMSQTKQAKTVDFGIDVSIIRPVQRECESVMIALDDLDDLVALEDM